MHGNSGLHAVTGAHYAAAAFREFVLAWKTSKDIVSDLFSVGMDQATRDQAIHHGKGATALVKETLELLKQERANSVVVGEGSPFGVPESSAQGGNSSIVNEIISGVTDSLKERVLGSHGAAATTTTTAQPAGPSPFTAAAPGDTPPTS